MTATRDFLEATSNEFNQAVIRAKEAVTGQKSARIATRCRQVLEDAWAKYNTAYAQYAAKLKDPASKAEAQAISHKMSATKGSSLEAGSLVWAKLQGYPWWPGLLFMHKGMLERKVEGQRELNVWFLGENSR